MKKKLPLIAIFLVFALGACVLLYPVLSSFINKMTATSAVKSYQSAVKAIDTSTQDAMLAAAREYNDELITGLKSDPFQRIDNRESGTYDSLLNVGGIMGYLDIPVVKIYLPIYHGVSDEALQKGVGHLPESSLPLGGEKTHAVLSAHCGLPNAHLFTDLDQMKMGDLFFVHVLEQTLAYRVDQILIVFPDESQALDPVPGEDHVTLLTCTPYGINSHRILVRGIRTPYVQEANADVMVDFSDELQSKSLWLWILIPLLLIKTFLLLWLRKRKRLKIGNQKKRIKIIK